MTEAAIKKDHLYTSHQPEYREIELREIWNLIKHSYKLIIIIVFIFLIAGVYYAETRPPAYRSTAMIEVNGSNGTGALSSGNTGGVSLSLSSMLSTQTSSADVETVLLKSPYVLGEIAHQLHLDISVLPHYSNFFTRKWAELLGTNKGNVTISLFNVPNTFLAKKFTLMVHNQNQYSLSTKDGKKILDGSIGELISTTYFSMPIQIQVTALNAKPGTQFDVIKQPLLDVADSIAGGLDIKNASTEGGNATGILTLNYISRSREGAQKLLNHILLMAITKNVREKSQETAKTLAFISRQLPTSKDNLQNTEMRLNTYSVESGSVGFGAEGSTLINNIGILQQTLEQAKFEKMMLLQKFTAIHPLVITATQKENEIKREIQEMQDKLKKLPLLSEKEISLQRDARIQSGIYTDLILAKQNTEMMKASVVSGVRILSLASYPVSRIPVLKRKIIFGSLALGLMISLAIIFLRHALSPVIEDPDTIERKLSIPVSAIIPYSEQQARHNKKTKSNQLYANTKSFLLARENPNDVSIEGIRSLRTAIQMLLLEAKNNVIAITGCSPAIGKSFISSNLAMLLSDLDKRILLIDADLRLGKLFRYFGKMKEPGLATYLKNETSLEKIIQNVVPDKLDFISTGLYPEKPTELLSQKSLGELIQTLQTRYDIVIFDTPPILAVTDATLISRYAATNLMVLGVGKNQLKEVLHAKSMLEKGGASLTSAVFNTLKQQKAGFGHNYGYSNYHYTYGK